MRLQVSTQKTINVDDYTEQFQLLMTRAGVKETEQQQVGHFLGGLIKPIRDDLMLLDILTFDNAISLGRRSKPKNKYLGTSVGAPIRSTPHATAFGVRCFNCNEIGHRQSECPNLKAKKLALNINGESYKLALNSMKVLSLCYEFELKIASATLIHIIYVFHFQAELKLERIKSNQPVFHLMWIGFRQR